MLITLCGALVTAFALCAVMGPGFIKFLHKLNFGQSIRECGPKEHMKKSGTPTMGGIMMLLAIVAAVAVWCNFTPALCIALLLTFGHALIGFVDDYIKVVMKRNLGLTAAQKFFMQFVLAGAYVYYIENHVQSDLSIAIPGTEYSLALGWLYYVLVFLLLVGTTNAVNLTDGLDGLAASVTLPVTVAYAFIAYHTGHFDLSVFALAITGACLGFLLFNHYPARVFMGDTGSLAIGGGVAALALLTHTELLLVILGGIYVMEASSVIMQVSYFRLTGGKRIFRMTPIHHHFELGGWKETKIVKRFFAASCLLCLLGVLLWVNGNGGF